MQINDKARTEQAIRDLHILQAQVENMLARFTSCDETPTRRAASETECSFCRRTDVRLVMAFKTTAQESATICNDCAEAAQSILS